MFAAARDPDDDAAAGARRGARGARNRRLGRGPAGERDMDVDDDEDEDDAALSMIDIRSRILAGGFTEAELMDTITEVGLIPYYFFSPLANPLYFLSTNAMMFGSE